MEVIHQAARDAAAAAHGQAGDIYARAAAVLGLSEGRTKALVAQAARELGLAAPRKRRCDAGRSMLTEDHLRLIGGVITHDRRAGKWEISCVDAIDMLWSAGRLAGLPSKPSASQVLRRMRARGLHPEQLARPAAHVRMRTEHVNQVWEMDFSTTVLVKARNTGELALLDVEGEVYKNKLHNYVQVMDGLLTRAIATEHASGCIAVRLLVGGESAPNALDFLMWAVTQRYGAGGQPMPFHGVPFVLYTDQGSAFRSAVFGNFCRAMDIRLLHHEPKNSRATGQVENAQNLFERGLESRLRFMDTSTVSVARINAIAELWMHAYNGTRIHSRHGMTRYAAWSTIGREHLRLAPGMDAMRALPASMAQPRTVTGELRVSFAIKGQGSQDYDLRAVPGVSRGDKVFVTLNPYDLPNVRVGVTDRDTGEIAWHQVAPVSTGWMGYETGAPVLSKDYKALPATPAEQLRQAVDSEAFARPDEAGVLRPATPAQVKAAQMRRHGPGSAPYLGQFDPLADIEAKAAELPAHLQRPGTPLAVQAAAVAARVLTPFEAARKLAQDHDLTLTPKLLATLKRLHPEGVPEDSLPDLAARLTVCADLRVVQGGGQ